MNAMEDQNKFKVNLLALYDDVMRRNTTVAGYEREHTDFVSRFTTRTKTRRLIIWHQLSPSNAADVIDIEWNAVHGCAAQMMWKLYAHDPAHHEMRVAFLARGYKEKDHSTLMWATVESVLDSLPRANDTIVAKKLSTAESLDTYLEIWNEVWPDEPNASYVDDYRVLLRENDPGIVLFAGYAANDNPVSTGYLFHQPGDVFALLCGGTTKTDWRRQRAYTSTLVARARAARERGATYLAVEASPQSHPILARLGFNALSTLVFYEKPVTP